ncbi:hypothetical protein BFG52_05875 [Acinetobacter larvae]|uniref:Uncharacterized protein n=1 Tax=Acinetobacter larvae TaxID=1789224 RepID=A0A1B2LYC4_9GAMM|nr:hypothetical protein BFG52_05875 [Acinetobacter larvae]
MDWAFAYAILHANGAHTPYTHDIPAFTQHDMLTLGSQISSKTRIYSMLATDHNANRFGVAFCLNCLIKMVSL